MTPDLQDLRDINRDVGHLIDTDIIIARLKRPVSGAYRNATPAGYGSIIELRVDVDGRRPQERLSGDLYTHFTIFGIPITFYTGSFVVEDVDESSDGASITLTGPVIHYDDPGNTDDSIAVRIPRVNWFSPPAAACVQWFTAGALVQSYTCPRISAYFRTATLEVDRFQGTVFPPELDPDIDPSPSGLPGEVSIAETFRRSGIDLTVTHDETLNDPDGPDVEDNWDEGELHDLMEDRFDSYADRLQWNMYGVIVPKFGDPNYNSGYYGTMFDWGGWQVGDSHLRQGWAIAEDAIRGREVGGLYDTSPKKDRLILQTMIHEAGHAFNLPHSWQRGINPDSGSESFMNYPWSYTDNGGGETAFWTNFRWEFDDTELVWMRHANRADVIFGGNDWIGNNLSADLRPGSSLPGGPLSVTLIGPDVFDMGVPVRLALQLTNTSDRPIEVLDRLEPEDGSVHVVIERPDGEIVEYVPPVRRLMADPDLVTLKPGESVFSDIGLSFGARGHQFLQAGQYVVTVYVAGGPIGFVATASRRLRVAHPRARASENLVHLVTGVEAAQFLYYGGTGRDPVVAERLTEAVDRYATTDPVAVRHISAALARNAARPKKRVVVRKGKRVIIADKARPGDAKRHLDAAVSELPKDEGRDAALTPVAEAKLVTRVADGLAVAGERDQAAKVLNEGISRLSKRELPLPTRRLLEDRLDRVKAPAKKAKKASKSTKKK